MNTIGDMARTGRRLPGPGASLVELEHEGLRHTAVVFAPVHRGQRCLNSDLEIGMGFMTDPQVTGLVRLSRHVPDEGAFIYPTGTVWSVAELVRELADNGESGGVKAGLELCYLVGEILVEAADQSQHSNLLGHGSIDPWRLMVKPDGQTVVIGYGLPRPEIEAYLEDENRLPGEDSLRYCAPENLKAGAQPDLSADLFSLSLVALELMVGRPVYDGLVADVRNQAARAEAARRLYQWREKLPESVREVLGKALKPDPDIRYRDGLDFVYGVHDLLGGIDAGDGPSLREIVTQVRARQKRGTAVRGGNTGALSKAELAELAADIDNEGVATDLPPPRQDRPEPVDEDGNQPRWRRASRGSRGGAAEEPSRRRGRSARRSGANDITEKDNQSARERLLRRLRDRSDDDRPPPRRRRSSSMERTKPAELSPRAAAAATTERLTPPPAPERAPAPEPPAQEEATPTSGRRRRGGRGAALLERLRSSSGGTTRTQDRPARTVDDEATVVNRGPIDVGRPPTPPPEPEPEPEPQPTPEPAAVDEEDEATVVSTELAQKALAAELEARQAAPSPTGGPTVAVVHEGARVEVAWKGIGTTASEAAAMLGLASTDLMGTRTSAFWLRKEGQPLPPGAAVSEADLLIVDNTPIPWTLQLPNGETQVVVGGAVSVGSLGRALARTFGLDGARRIARNGEPLDPELPAALVPAGRLEVIR